MHASAPRASFARRYLPRASAGGPENITAFAKAVHDCDECQRKLKRSRLLLDYETGYEQNWSKLEREADALQRRREGLRSDARPSLRERQLRAEATDNFSRLRATRVERINVERALNAHINRAHGRVLWE